MLAKYNLDLPKQLQTIIVGTKVFPIERPYSWEGDFGAWLWANPYAYICPSCAKVWAIAPIAGREREEFELVGLPCEACGGGSLLYTQVDHFRDPALLDFAPKEFLTRELMLALKEIETCK